MLKRTLCHAKNNTAANSAVTTIVTEKQSYASWNAPWYFLQVNNNLTVKLIEVVPVSSLTTLKNLATCSRVFIDDLEHDFILWESSLNNFDYNFPTGYIH